MKHPYFNKAVTMAYDRLVPVGEQVPYFIYFEVNPEDIDVNIHPTKTEIKFENEQAIWQILLASVRETIGMFNDVPTIDFDTQGKPDIPVFSSHPNDVQMPKVNYNPQYNPFENTDKPPKKQLSAKWEELYDGLKNKTMKHISSMCSEMITNSKRLPIIYLQKSHPHIINIKANT